MSEKRASLEMIAPSVEEAVTRGLAELGLPEDAVNIEVLDAGSRGLFGLGFRQARVRLTIKAAVQMLPSAPVAAAETTRPEPVQQAKPVQRSEAEAPKEPAPKVEVPAKIEAPEEPEMEAEAGDDFPAVEPDSDVAVLLNVARDTVEELLMKMKVRARVTVHMGEPEDERDRTPVLVDIRGDDLSILIGPKAETLNALQYIAGLIVGKEIGHSVALVVDVEGFRARRSQQIRQLAQRMAEQAVRTGRRQVLEPMPANERRLVHIELRNHPGVTTESVGEEPRRKVTIIPK
jgi:spoIIIJ-associated protein